MDLEMNDNEALTVMEAFRIMMKLEDEELEDIDPEPDKGGSERPS